MFTGNYRIQPGHQLNKPFWNYGFWTLGLAFKFFLAFSIFFRSLASKKFSGVQKSYVWTIVHAKQFSLLIFHSGSLWGITDIFHVPSEKQGILVIVVGKTFAVLRHFWGKRRIAFFHSEHLSLIWTWLPEGINSFQAELVYLCVHVYIVDKSS